MTDNQLVPEKTFEVAKQLNNSVFQVIGQDSLMGFEKAYLIASATSELKKLLNDEYMKPIMELQGNRLGFKTDKDKDGGYAKDVVKNCLIEAVLTGVQPFGNHFNIIAGNCYITKEGFGFLLKNIKGLDYGIIPELPRINAQSAAVVMNIEWTLNGVTKSKKIDIPIKVNSYMGADGVIGKATRKARKWLFEAITGVEVSDGDITDVEGKVVGSKLHTPVDKEAERIALMIEDAKTKDDLEAIRQFVKPEQQELFDAKLQEVG